VTASLIGLGYLSALAVGAVLGVLGAGGATITVPIFVYFFGVPPKVATVLSLGVVGGVGLLGLVRAYPKKELHWAWAMRVAAPSMVAVWLTRKWLVPLIPSHLDYLLMLGFSVLVFFVARAMLASSHMKTAKTLSATAFMLRASGVGVVTGLLGAGGGFLIVPMLTEWAGLPFRIAASTSLLVIVANSAMGLWSGWSEALAPWFFSWGVFAALAALGLVLSSRFASKLEASKLKRIFAYFLFAVAAMTLLTEALRFGSHPLVRLREVGPSVTQEIRYAGSDNFLGRPVQGYLAPECWLTREAAQALVRVQAQLKLSGLSLRVYDCYRPQRAVDDFVAWAKDLSDQKQKAIFYPRVDKKDLFRLGYIAEKSGHSRGSTVDLTIDGLDMGTPYDFFDEQSHTEQTGLSDFVRANRQKLKSAMESAGFKNLPEEWWHYTLKNEPYPDRFFNFLVE